MASWFIVSAIASVAAGSVSCAAEPRPLARLTGEPVSAEFLAAAADGAWEFRIDGNRAPVSPDDVVSWGAPIDAERGPLVVFADGGLLSASLDSIRNDDLVVTSVLVGDRAVPLDALAGILVGAPDDLVRRDLLLDRILSLATPNGRAAADLVILDNGDEIAGTLASIGHTTIEIDAAVGRVSADTKRVVAVLFNPTLVRRASHGGPMCWVGLSDGSRLLTSSFESDGVKARLAPLGARKAAGEAWEVDHAAVVFLQPLARRAVYLSDLPPAGYRHVPYLSLEWPYRLDRCVTGSLLRAEGRLYLKGVGMHSASRLSFAIPSGMTRLDALAAIDEAAGREGSVVFRVFVDAEERYRSAAVRGGDQPASVSVDLTGGRIVSLIVDYGEWGDTLDHADWLEARFVP